MPHSVLPNFVSNCSISYSYGCHSFSQNANFCTIIEQRITATRNLTTLWQMKWNGIQNALTCLHFLYDFVLRANMAFYTLRQIH